MSRSTREAEHTTNLYTSNPPRADRSHDIQAAIANEGVSYVVRYIGCLEVKTSMKTLEFEVRSKVAKECIKRVCEAAGLKTASGKSGPRYGATSVAKLLGERPRMEHAGTDVTLTISSGCLVLSDLHSGQVIVRHDMPRISFASGGDTDTLDFVAYVAKNLQEWRACYVLECGGGLATEIIATIGQAFDLRFKQFMTKPASVTLALNSLRHDRDYYNDLPGKVPPEMGPPPVPPLPAAGVVAAPGAASVNLMDLHSPIPATPAFLEHHYVNDSAAQPATDVFDMHPFGGEDAQRAQLWQEPWYHGAISRAAAEALLARDGDFLVRESQASAGQYVLTGVQAGVKKHLLLIDPFGVVRTKDRMFENVSHLIKYHCDNQLPIISSESALVLRTPVPRTHSLPT